MLELNKVSVIITALTERILEDRPELGNQDGAPCMPSGECGPMDTSCHPSDIPCEPDLICIPTILP